MDEVDIILRDARNSLGPLCFGECAAKCCKRGKLLLEKNQVPIVAKQNPVVARQDGSYELSLEGEGCPNLLDNNKCGIFTDSLRPKMCDDYPLFRRGKFIFVASSCTGFARGDLAIYLVKLGELGFTIVTQ